MKEKTVAIIGAGLSGLSAGIFALLNGYRVLLFEHAASPGGVSASWKRKDYNIDGGIHFYMGFKPGPTRDLFDLLGADQADQYLPLETYCSFRDTESGHRLDLTRDLPGFVRDAAKISPADERLIKNFVSWSEAFRGFDLTASLAKPPDMASLFDQIGMLWQFRRTFKYMQGKCARPMVDFSREIKHPFLREVLNHIFLPDVPVYFVLMFLGILADGNIGLRKDGSAGFIGGMEKRFLDLGGEIHYRSTVTEIMVKNGSAAGVCLKEGREIATDKVISTGDGRDALYQLLGGRYITPQLKKAHEELKLFDPLVMVNYGLNRQFPGEPSFISLRPKNKPAAGRAADPWLLLRLFNFSDRFAPPGRTLLQASFDSAWRPWDDLRRDPKAYKAEKRDLAEQMLDSLSELWPDLKSRVEMTDVATPYTWWRYTLNREGAYEGFAVSHQSFKTQIKRTLPGLSDFVLAGQWVSPGGGVVPSLLTGRHAVMILCRQDGKKFSSGRP